MGVPVCRALLSREVPQCCWFLMLGTADWWFQVVTFLLMSKCAAACHRDKGFASAFRLGREPTIWVGSPSAVVTHAVKTFLLSRPPRGLSLLVLASWCDSYLLGRLLNLPEL